MILNLITQQSTIIFACIKDSNSIEVKTCSLTRTVVRHLLTRNLLPLALLLIFITLSVSGRRLCGAQKGKTYV